MSPSSPFFTPSLKAARANPENVFTFPSMRFTLLSPRLIRLEYSSMAQFEDRPSQVFWYRNQPRPLADIQFSQNALQIETEAFKLSYQEGHQLQPAQTLECLAKHSNKIIHLDEPNPERLPGTTRTLDEANGAVELQPGLISTAGWVQLEDTPSLIFNHQGWLEKRPLQKGYRDIYLLIYGKDYKSALQDYQKISGTPPLLPRAFLGNWWSRYWAYSQEDIKQLVETFQQKKIPLSVLIMDMDWHITQTGNQSNGWTGFSWNDALFPEPEALIDWLHSRALITSLNLHPADGIHSHEAQYSRAASAMGLDPKSSKPIPFNIVNRRFAETYFEQMLHPLEEQGIDFWWLDWQQGKRTTLSSLDPLWWLNHLHFYDLGRTTGKRPIVFSRWGGSGNQRYPIGFSGDTIISWKSLAFQPYFTATSANAAYGWWSHDIGGHMHGMEDGELYARWVQFGTLSPILRLHCANDVWIDHSPWAFGARIEEITRQAMQFRHALIPYLYTMSRRNEQDGLPLISPLYYDWPEDETAYQVGNQYLFGSQLMAAPIITPINATLGQAKQAIWFPPGIWFDFFNGQTFNGPAWKIKYYTLNEMPMFARAGAIVPLQSNTSQNGAANPDSFDVHIFPGQDGHFTLYEDDGITQRYLETGGCATEINSSWAETSQQIEIPPVTGNTEDIPHTRTFNILFRGICEPNQWTAELDGKSIEITLSYDISTGTVRISPIRMSIRQHLSLKLQTDAATLIAPAVETATLVDHFLRYNKLKTDTKRKIMDMLPELIQDIGSLNKLHLRLNKKQKMGLIEIITGVGAVKVTSPSAGERIVLTNPDQLDGFICHQINQPVPISPDGTMLPKTKDPIMIDYFGLIQQKY